MLRRHRLGRTRGREGRTGLRAGAIVFSAQPSSALKLVGQVSAPSFVDNRLNNDGRVIPISLDHLVESLFTARAISRKPGGTGLGTKIIKDVVDAHRGQIAVQSREGVGTTFTLLLPVQQNAAGSSRQESRR